MRVCFPSPEPEVPVQGSHDGIGEPAHVGSRDLGTLGDVGGHEGDEVVGGDEGLVERGQQVRVGAGVEVREHLQQVRHGALAGGIGTLGTGRLCGVARDGRPGFTALTVTGVRARALCAVLLVMALALALALALGGCCRRVGRALGTRR